jgi:hypothetical protein
MHGPTETIVLKQTARENMPNKTAKLSLIIILGYATFPSLLDEAELPR